MSQFNSLKIELYEFPLANQDQTNKSAEIRQNSRSEAWVFGENDFRAWILSELCSIVLVELGRILTELIGLKNH